jgi:hypothetical protein
MRRPVAKLAMLFLSLTMAAAYVVRSTDAGAAGMPCSIAIKGSSPTARACAKGGRKEAQDTMKAMVAAANKNGGTFQCDGCHKDVVTYELRKNAVDDYKALQAASGMK